MYDIHYDLFTYIYINRKNIKEVKKYCKKIFSNNINGGIFNLFYMSPNEMEEELNIQKEEIDIIENLKEVANIIRKEKIIQKHIIGIYGIEGLDYLKDIKDIDKIYDLGVRSVNIVWNNDNKFGGGAKGDDKKGLTTLGKELVEKLVEKNIAIDLSHANEKTFYDIIEICYKLKEKGRIPIVFASHSNVRQICNNPRNLSDNQIKSIKGLNGIIGIVGVKQFCINEKTFDNNKQKYYDAYIDHIKYIRNLLGGVDNIAIATDDMTYYKTEYYDNFNVFKQENIRSVLKKLLLVNGFCKQDIEKIFISNFKTKILDRLELENNTK